MNLALLLTPKIRTIPSTALQKTQNPMQYSNTPTLEQALQQAVAYQRAQQINEAEQLYKYILQRQPQHPDANHNLGMLLLQSQQPNAALAHFKKALEAAPTQGQYWLSYISALQQTGQTAAALQVLQHGRRLGLSGGPIDTLEHQLAPNSQGIPSPNVSDDSAALANGFSNGNTGGPTVNEMAELVRLFNLGRDAETESMARNLTTKYPGHGFSWKALGVSLRRQGKVELACEAMQNATRLLPDDGDAHYNLGNIQQEQGRLIEAENSYRQALALNPQFGPAHHNLANALQAQGRFAEAETSYRHALQIQPEYADAHCNLANTLQDMGRLLEAEASYRRALEIKPDHVGALSNLGLNLQEQHRHIEAEACHRQAIALEPNHAGSYNNLGLVLRDRGRSTEAAASFRHALRIKPDHANAHNNLGNILKEQGRLAEAEACYRQALAIQPNHVHAHNNLGNTLSEQRRFTEAESSYRRSLVLKPDYADTHNNLGHTLKELRRLTEAETCFRRALEIAPEHSEAHCNLGNLLKDQGRLGEAESSYRQALEVKPDYLDARSNLLGLLNYSDTHSPEQCLEEAQRYGRFVEAKLPPHSAPFSSWNCPPEPARLRVGLVSGDLRTHPVGYFLESLLAHIDPARIELSAYPSHHQEDALTERIRPRFAAWKPLLGLSDEMVARTIRNDGIHILIDLSGHTAHNRLPMFAWKPSPVQVSWLGYFATTGVAAIDYLLADETGVPATQRGHFTESIWYLPRTRLCFTPPATNLPVTPLPAMNHGHVTFGSFQNLAKVGDNVLTAWSEILRALPDTRLRWQCKQFSDPTVVSQTLNRLDRHGIALPQLSLHGESSREAYLAAYAEVDIVLDSFPYPGGTTTCEALWMGVPTLTLAGDRLHARQGASLMAAAGLEDWIVTSHAAYVATAITAARGIPALDALRAGMRERIKSSPLFDAQGFADNFVAAMWAIWREKQQHHPFTLAAGTTRETSPQVPAASPL